MQNKEKTKVIFIYGPPAVGKLTTAELLAEKTGYKLLHNHLTADLVSSILDRENKKRAMLIAELRFKMLELALTEKVTGLIMTGAYAYDFVYPNGKTDEWFVKELERITNEHGGIFYGVNLQAEESTLLARTTEESRHKYGKIKDKEVLKETLSRHTFGKDAPIENNITIRNEDISIQEIVEIILKRII